MPARLIVEAGTASPPVCELNPEKVVSLGRNKLSHVILRDHHASRLHAQIFHKDRCWYLRDCGATNRTELNGKVITKKDTVALDNGARIVIGKIHLRFLTSLTDVTPPSGNPLAGNPEADASADQDSTALHVDELSALVTFLNDSLLETTPYGLLKLAMDVVQHQTGATLCGFLSLDPDDPLPRVVVPAEGAVDAALSKQLTRLAMGANQAIWLARTKAADADSESLAAFSDAICIPLGARSPGNGSSEAAPVRRWGLCTSTRPTTRSPNTSSGFARPWPAHWPRPCRSSAPAGPWKRTIPALAAGPPTRATNWSAAVRPCSSCATRSASWPSGPGSC